MLRLISGFLSSKLITILLMAALAGIGWYVVSVIQKVERQEIALNQANASIKEMNRRHTAELAISKHLSLAQKEIREDETESDCPNPAIINNAIKRLRDGAGRDNE